MSKQASMRTFLATIPLLAVFAAAAPMPAELLSTRATTPLRPGVFYINGQPVDTAGASPGDSVQLKSICSVNDTVTTCAQKTAAKWSMLQDYTGSTGHMSVPETCTMSNGANGACHIDFDYFLAFSGCHLSDPQYTWRLTEVDCNAEECDDAWMFQSSTTQTNSDGFHVGASISAGINIGVFTASVAVNTDWNTMWSWSNTTTLTESLSYKLGPGDECTPTTIQYNMQCQLQMQIAGNGQARATFDNLPNNPYYFTPCSSSDTSVNVGQDDKWNAICQALTKPQGLAMNVLSPGGTDAWAMQGCD